MALPKLVTVSFAIAGVAAVLQPIEIVAVNWSEMSLDFAGVLRRCALSFSLVGIVLTGITGISAGVAWLVGVRRSIERLVALLVALLIGVVVQTNFFLWDYGVFDGSPIDWSEHAVKGGLELLVWSALLGFAALRSDAVYRSAYVITAAALAVQVAGSATKLYEHAPYPAKKGVEDSRPGRPGLKARFSTFSRSSNVLVVVLDALQSDLFAELLTDPEISSEVPPGITYYRNAVAHYSLTRFSLPSILTSAFIGNRVPGATWRALQMKQSVPARLAAKGQSVSMLTTDPFVLACGPKRVDYDCLSQLAFLKLDAQESAGARDWDKEEDLRSLGNLSLFRLAPHFAKPWVYAGGDWIIPGVDLGPDVVDSRLGRESRRDLRIFAQLTRSASARDMPPTFKFLHFFGAHVPNSLTRNCVWNGFERPRKKDIAKVLSASYRQRRYVVDSASCVVTRLFAFLARLDEIGVYDDTLIFIVADHGIHNQPIDLDFARPPIPDTLHPPTPEPGSIRHAAPNKGVPLFLVKRAGARHGLRISDAPVALCDIPKSIFGELGLEENYACDSIFEATRASRRPHFATNHAAKVAKGAHVFDRYFVDHHSWFADSWTRTPDAATEARP